MLLLPDITINGSILSIQDPYILNGYIITDIDIDYHLTDIEQKIVIKNENNDCLSIGFNTLERVFSGKMHEFICRNGYDANVEGRRDVLDWRLYNINDYYRDMKAQCSRIIDRHYSRLYYTYIDSLKTELRRQNREHYELTMLNTDSRVYTSSWNTWNLSADTSESITTFNDYRDILRYYGTSVMNDPWLSTDVCTIGVDATSQKKKYIHQYNYKPEYIHHYMSEENKDTTLLLGAEIEVDCGGESEEHAKNVLEIICGIDQENTDKALENKMYCTHDGSLKNGIEFDTMPCSLEYHKKEMKYKEMFKYLDENGYKAHDTNTCGLHIHADRKYLGKTELVQQLTISKILYILEKFNDEICVIARRDNNYSKFVGKEEVNRSLDKLYGKYNNAGKKVALNLQHKESIEFRCFKGTLKYETFILTLEFVKDIIDYAKSINIEEIELIQWSDLMNTFSDELKAYYKERLEREKQKKDESKNGKATDGSHTVSFVNGNRITISTDNIATSITPYSYGLTSDYTYYDEPVAIYPYALGISNLNLGDCSSFVSLSLNNHTTEKSTIEILKDKEKTLKKRIKYSDNPMEKKNIEKELKEIQKELKKEKKRIKLNNTES